MGNRRLAVGLIILAIVWVGVRGLNRTPDTPTEPTPPPANATVQRSAVRILPPVRTTILGAPMSDVDNLLRGWVKAAHGAGPTYYKYDRDVRIVVNYRNGIAVGVAILSLRDRPITPARAEELTNLVGEAPNDRNMWRGQLHELYFGEPM